METVASDALLEALERHWGSWEFRPLQRESIQAVLDRRDVAVVMPTGGGKSLCYQMPVLFLPGTAVVVSPLIALMKDQVERLNQRGIRAAALNSSTPYPEQKLIQRQIREGTLRLLYVAPERLLREDTVELIQQANVCYYAIDEAHCISEWGHEFRPDYRRLGELRQWHPEANLVALTASATRRVRHDILAQLGMRDPAKFIRSFDRKNLRYLAQKTDARQQGRLLEAALEAHAGESVIVYASTIALVEETAARLHAAGIGAVAYHAQMAAERRRSAQERWMAGSATVLVGTIAFGMGIDKPDVRAVIHLSLPKSLEQYYQEAGRAGRDGLPSDCLLLWQQRDAGVIAYFIKEIANADERQRAWRRYNDIRTYAESVLCRHVTICRHFGEGTPSRICGMCDVCGPVPEWYGRALGTTSAPRVASAPSRPGSRLRPGGAAPQDESSEAAAVFQPSAPRPASVPSRPGGRLRLGGASPQDRLSEAAAVFQPSAPRPASVPSRPADRLRPTPQNESAEAAAVFQRSAPRPASVPSRLGGATPLGESPKSPEAEVLFQKLRAWRLEVARRDKIAPFIVFHDSVLRSIAAARPLDLRALAAISGLGPVKLEKYGAEVLRVLEANRKLAEN